MAEQHDPLVAFRDIFASVEALPPRPKCFMAHHAVPYGRVYRQWNTRGELLVWVNRGELADIPRRQVVTQLQMLIGIPVVNAVPGAAGKDGNP